MILEQIEMKPKIDKAKAWNDSPQEQKYKGLIKSGSEAYINKKKIILKQSNKIASKGK